MSDFAQWFVPIWWLVGLVITSSASYWLCGIIEELAHARRVEVTPRRAQRDMAAIGRGGYLSGEAPTHRPGHPEYRCIPGDAGGRCRCDKCRPPHPPLFTRPEPTSHCQGCGVAFIGYTTEKLCDTCRGAAALVTPNEARAQHGIGYRPDVGWIEFQDSRGRTVRPECRRQTVVQDWAGNIITTLADQYRAQGLPTAILSTDKEVTEEKLDAMAEAWARASNAAHPVIGSRWPETPHGDFDQQREVDLQ